MLNLFLQKLSAGIFTIALSISSFIAPEAPKQIVDELVQGAVEEQTFGAAPQFVGGKPYFLSGSGVASTDTSIPLVSFTLPVDNREITTADLVGGVSASDKYYITIEPNDTNKKEFVSCTGVTQNSSTVAATLTGCTRGLQFTTPYTASSSLRQSHGGGARVVISNPPQLYQSIIDYINNATTSGAVDASTIAKGIVELATGVEAASTTPIGGGGTTAPLALSTTISTSTKPVSGHFVVVTDNSGTINNFLASSTIANSTHTGTTTIATTTFTGPITTTFSSNFASSTVIVFTTASSTWTKPAGLRNIIVEVVASGGNGGTGQDSGTTDTPGGGGGGGGYGMKIIPASVLGATESINVGQAPSGSSNFGSHCSATGGTSGAAGSASGTGGIGGVGSNCNLNIKGQGGGGPGGAVNLNGGEGGSSVFGGGGPSASGTGVAGGNYGGGGSGGGINGASGGSGANGVVIVTEVYY